MHFTSESYATITGRHMWQKSPKSGCEQFQCSFTNQVCRNQSDTKRASTFCTNTFLACCWSAFLGSVETRGRRKTATALLI